MARKLRLEYPGAIYHVVNRGNRLQPIFLDDADRESFLAGLEEACGKTGWQVHAFCLMPDHFHFVLETPSGNLVAGMKWLLGTYTVRFNRRHKITGHLFAGRYRTSIIEGSGNGYLRTVAEYVHLNPARARLLQAEESLSSYRWSSFPQYLLPPAGRAPWLRVDRVFGESDVTADTRPGRRHFESLTETCRAQAETRDWDAVRQGWCVGSDQFKKELLTLANGRFRGHHSGQERRESSQAQAENIIAQALREAGWEEADLARSRKGDPVKIALASQLRRETTMTLKWLAQRLHMGAWTHLNNRLYFARQKEARRPSKKPRERRPVPIAAVEPALAEPNNTFDITWD
jgi:putative transposase